VADLVLYFYTLFDNNPTFRFPLNRRELAHFAGTTKESLIRTLTEFKNDRIIELNDREVKINSMEIVKTLSRLG
jgi:CRP-like cAMP-binding protein